MPGKKSPPQNKNAAASAVDDSIGRSQTIIAAQRKEIFQGPLPSPDDLGRYEKVLPGLSDRIMKMAEKEQAIREQAIVADQQQKARLLEIAKNESNGALKAQNKGQNIGLAISVMCVVFAFISMLMDKSYLITLGFLAVPTASLITAFFPRYREHQKRDNN